MLLGYARISKADHQDTAAQVDALEAAGCRCVFEEKATGGRWDRPELHRLLHQLRKGDVVVVWKPDRLSRSLKNLLHILEQIENAGAGFRSRTRAGLQAARNRGRKGGRRPKLPSEQKAGILEMLASGRKSAAEVGRIFRVHRATIGGVAAEARAAQLTSGKIPATTRTV